MISIDRPRRAMVGGHQLNMAEIIRSSPVKFMLGGVAMFIRFAISHQVVIIGRILWKPRVSNRIRVCVRSYVMLARQNSIDDVKPWAIIRAMAPAKPHGVCVISAAMTKPIWLTDE